MRKEKEHESVEEVLRTFLHRCFTQRDIPGTLELLSPGFFGVGVWEGERVLSRAPYPIPSLISGPGNGRRDVGIAAVCCPLNRNRRKILLLCG